MNELFLDIIENVDSTDDALVTRVPTFGSAVINKGSQIIVRPNQIAVFVLEGKIADTFKGGRHTLNSKTIPIISRLQNWKYAFECPFKCEIYYFNMTLFRDIGWGTSQPLYVKDPKLGAIPLKAYGKSIIKITNPKKMYMNLIGQKSSFSVEDVRETISTFIVEGINNQLPKVYKSITELTTVLNDLSVLVSRFCRRKFDDIGIKCSIQILGLTPGEEIQKSLEKSASMKAIGDMPNYLIYQAGNSLTDQQNSQSGNSMQGMMGFLLATQMAQGGAVNFNQRGGGGGTSQPKEPSGSRFENIEPYGVKHKFCPECGNPVPASAKFCPNCGAKRSSK